MRIASIALETPDLARAAAFYGRTLGLPVEFGSESLAVRVGWTRLLLREGTLGSGRHHLAFTIPRRMLAEAKSWLTGRVELLRGQADQDEFEFGGVWNARSIYFSDPDGNVLEFIVRRAIADDGDGPFDATRIRCISEIGVAVPDVTAFAETAGEVLGLPRFGDGHAGFRSLGDADGLLIVVPQGRPWFPTATQNGALPLAVELDGVEPGVIEPFPGVVIRSLPSAGDSLD